MKAAGLRCYAVVAPGLEGLLAGELAALGISGEADTGGIAWEGDLASLYRANLRLRTATRVLVRVARFRATSFWELERRSRSIAWPSLVRPGSSVAFRVTTKKSRLYHSDAVAERLARSVSAAVRGIRIVDTAPTGDDEDEAGGGAQLFVVRVARDELTLSLDASGPPLYRRGYRQAVAKAPLRETLAAALVLASGWQPGEAVVDPFCGSGTIPIEAALIAARIAPGLAAGAGDPREFSLTHWPGFDAQLWQKCIDDAVMVSSSAREPVHRGYDRDEGAVAAARANAERAGVSEAVTFGHAAVSALTVPDGPPGWIVTNPPYGLRVGDDAGVRPLFAAFGRAMRERAPGWRLAMLSPDPALDAITARESGRRLEERIRTRNGGIPVRVVAG